MHVLVLACVAAVAVAAPGERRQVHVGAGDFFAEAGKFRHCTGLATRSACGACCDSTDFLHAHEATTCHGLCGLRPHAARAARQLDPLGDYYKETAKMQLCTAKATKGECDTCCDGTTFLYPYEVATCHGLCWTRPMTASTRAVRQLDPLGDYYKETAKMQVCTAKATKGECDTCCDGTTFLYPYEVATCHGLCWTRPMTASTRAVRQLDPLGDYYKETAKMQVCTAKATKGECDTCCDGTTFLYPYEVATCHGLCWTRPLTAAARAVRQLDPLGDYLNETEKHNRCRKMATKGDCDKCCDATSWLFSFEMATCHGICLSRPHTVAEEQTTAAPKPFELSNPCTAAQIAANHLFFPHPCDHAKYLHCDTTGHYFIQACPAGQFFEPKNKACIGSDTQPPLDPACNV